MNIKKQILFFIFISFIFLGCKSNSSIKENMIFIMVYDYESKEVGNVEIFSNGEKIGETDIYGRFILPLKKNYKELVFKKDKYEQIIVNLTEREFLYIKIGSSKYYAQMSESLLDKKDYSKAKEYIKKAIDIEKRADYEYLLRIIEKEMEIEKD